MPSTGFGKAGPPHEDDRCGEDVDFVSAGDSEENIEERDPQLSQERIRNVRASHGTSSERSPSPAFALSTNGGLTFPISPSAPPSKPPPDGKASSSSPPIPFPFALWTLSRESGSKTASPSQKPYFHAHNTSSASTLSTSLRSRRAGVAAAQGTKSSSSSSRSPASGGPDAPTLTVAANTTNTRVMTVRSVHTLRVVQIDLSKMTAEPSSSTAK